MSVGLMMLPAVAARHWWDEIAGQVRASMVIAVLASVGGLLAEYHLDLLAGPAIVLMAGVLWVLSLAAGPNESLAQRWLRRLHLSG